jgi:hypothetical protein
MRTNRPKALGLVLVSAACALFGWVAYEPASLVASLRLDGFVSEAVAVLASLTLATLAMVAGAALLYTSRARSLRRAA